MKIRFLAWVGMLLLFANKNFAQEKLSLAGTWNFQLDAANIGEKDKWFDQELKATIALPGTTDEAKQGTKTQGADYGILSRAYKYIGPAWYSRTITIPANWKNKEISLFLERVMWESKVWVDGRLMTTQDGLGVPHLHTLGKLSPGKHRLTIRINNDLIHNIGDKGHAYTEYTQSIWNGAVGKIQLQAAASTAIEDLQVYPDGEKRQLRVLMTMKNPVRMKVNYRIIDLQTNETVFNKMEDLLADQPQRKQLQGKQSQRPQSEKQKSGKQELERKEQKDLVLQLDFPIKLWDEFTPNRYRMVLKLENNNETAADFGFRSIGHSQSKVLINNAPVFMRGNLDCVHFPLTGYPSCDVKEWERIFKIYKSYGLNHVRFHSWCPPEAAFEAADKLGIYIQAEAIWIDWWMTDPPKDRPDMLTKGLPPGLGKNPSADSYTQDELERMLKAYGNHPSFTMMCIGNELGNSDFNVMAKWIEKLKLKDNRRLYAVSTARKIMPVDDYSATHNIPNVGGTYGLQGGRSDYDLEKNYSKSNIPIFAHEVGQFPVYPLWSEIDKYTGVLKARNLEVCRASAIANGLEHKDAAFHQASGALQKILYKSLIENFYRTPSSGGFQMLSMQDYQGQGEALVGWLDAFYDDKGTTDTTYFKQYNNEVVPLARIKKFVWENTETFSAGLEVANYGRGDLNTEIEWKVIAENQQVLGEGKTPALSIKRGTVKSFGNIELGLGKIRAATKAKLMISLPGTNFRNEWDLWIYSDSSVSSSDAAGRWAGKENKVSKSSKGLKNNNVLETNVLDQNALDALKKGKTVLLYAANLGSAEVSRPLFFSPLFWSNVFFPGQENTTLGALINDKHPAFASFPTDSFTDWQWESISKGRSFKMKDWPANLEPIVQPISDFHLNEKLAAIFECKVGKGKLLVCGYDIDPLKQQGAKQNPVAKQLRYSLLKYMESSTFDPQVLIDPLQLKKSFPFIKEAASGVPAEFSTALLYVKTGDQAPVLKRNTSYKMSGEEGIWEWDGKSAWYGKNLEITINPPQGVIGELYLHFEDWNNESRSAKIWMDGREFMTGTLDKKGKWIKLFVMREDTNDGKLTIKIGAMAGSNAMISEIVFVEQK
ncbi:glycoside hydrolase family 2 TIM barrel-domain containing protein [Pedobacter gandavensis]|uniref:sugar-binding domain-containing protein n=1 Tax=Pedobacter gandavensis TaxID=2679963 RepID=UPI002479ABF0|nr:sugar-binding domain-containing protein [Pedobacter gandavensis]WGQ11336.1 glycoside hydrolase family 2 TIM barrel-domain containing protein [Pedobacter gandavensis]